MRVAAALIVLAAVIASIAPAPAPAAPSKRSVSKSPRLWATINICDTKRHPNRVGVRVSMPGSGIKGERMYARIGLQHFKASEKRWVAIGDGAESGWLSLGSSKYLRRETGTTFGLLPPPAGQKFRIRALVAFEWRRGKTVVRQAYKRTAKRPGKVTGADPKGYSAAECVVAGP